MNNNRPRTYEEAEAYLLEIPRFTKKNEPGNTHLLLDALGHPERSFRVIHVAGTNGKGSVCAFLDSIFRQEGIRTGLFTSPHLEQINERFRICGEQIGNDEFYDAFNTVYDAVERLVSDGGKHPTYFEYVFAMGMCWFQRRKIDLLICETGLGGRLDATNSIRDAIAVVITSISLDHMEYLGDTIAKIAAEKAGIIRPSVPVIYCAKDPESAEVIRNRARELGSVDIPMKPDMVRVLSRSRTSIECELILPHKGTVRVHIPFSAMYQTENAALAVMCALQCKASMKSVINGIARTLWPGRMEEIQKDVILDGAHNIDAVSKLSEEIRRIAQTRKVSLLIAIVTDKDHGAMVTALCQAAKYESVITTSVGGGRKMDANVLAKEFIDAGQNETQAVDDPAKAYRMALGKKGDSVLICAGSLYLVGAIRTAWKEDQTEHILEIDYAEL